MHSGSKQDSLSPISHSSYPQSHEISSPIFTSLFELIVDDEISPRSSRRVFNNWVDDAPSSSSPDLLSPQVTSSSSSPDVPLTQKAFNDRLHTLLQDILDQQRVGRESSADDSQDSLEDECEWVKVSRDDSEYDSDNMMRRVVRPTRRNDYSDDDAASSSASSADSLGVWASTPRDSHPYCSEEYAETPLTHRNKRKHDDSHNFSDNCESDGDHTAVEAQSEYIPRKKARLEEGSFTSTSSSFSYQTNQTASSRKLRSLSASSPFTSAVSTTINLPADFHHPILHPPTEPLQVPISRGEVAEARIKALLERETSYRVQDGLPAGFFGSADLSSNENEEIFGIEPDFRCEVVQWILDVLPPTYLKSSDLYRHLICSEETRFHAMYLFSRFFLRVGECCGQGGAKETSSMRRARRELTWDAAFCCLAISTKFYHDFLEPLFPISSRNFLTISPQFLSHDQFERLQRDILNAFDYEIHGVTPHAFFEELWDALPSLQEILKFRRTRRIVRNEMWESVQLAALQCDIMRFPVSLLTAAALVEGIIVALVDEYEQDESDSPSQSSNDVAREDTHLGKACEWVTPVSKDIVRLLGVPEADLKACRHWLSLVTRD